MGPPTRFACKISRPGTASPTLAASMRIIFALGLAGLLVALPGLSQNLNLPRRPVNAVSGSEFVESIASLGLPEREERIFSEVARGNVPDFLRRLQPVTVTLTEGTRTHSATYFVTPDYLAVGSDEDYLLTPLTPATAQRIADRLGCTLPTRKLVDDIHAAATKLAPSNLPPDAAMTTVKVFAQHHAIVRRQRAEQLQAHPLGALVAGHKKDVVISARLTNAPGKVAIYGWHRLDGSPLQPLYLGHTQTWVDYSHGARLVQRAMTVNGAPTQATDVLADATRARLLSDEGPVINPRYPVSAPGVPAGFQPSQPFGEETLDFTFAPGVKIHLNAPARTNFIAGRPVQLILYALPNGNTTAQTVGRQLQPGDDWHYDIQHIGAQSRYLRDRLRDRVLVVAYLEADGKSWPAWRKQHDPNNQVIPRLVEAVKGRFREFPVRLTLTGHSGGGSFTFGYLNAVARIPDDVERIAFLDSTYAYDPAQGHADKLAAWLQASEHHRLSVLAYDDAVALLDGKPFVSATGGTWYRSHLLRTNLAEHFPFTRELDADFQKYVALDGRVKFLLRENPGRAVLHTVQVEKNGFIQSLLSGTPEEGRGYRYFGPRAYAAWIQRD